MWALRSSVLGLAGVCGLPHGTVLQRGASKGCLVWRALDFRSFCIPFYENGRFHFFSLRPGHKASCTRAPQSTLASQTRDVNGISIVVAPVLSIEAAVAPTTKVVPKVLDKAVCGFCGEAKEKLLLCSKCKVVRYCHADHQRQHWFSAFEYAFQVGCFSPDLNAFSLLKGPYTSSSAARPFPLRRWR